MPITFWSRKDAEEYKETIEKEDKKAVIIDNKDGSYSVKILGEQDRKKHFDKIKEDLSKIMLERQKEDEEYEAMKIQQKEILSHHGKLEDFIGIPLGEYKEKTFEKTIKDIKWEYKQLDNLLDAKNEYYKILKEKPNAYIQLNKEIENDEIFYRIHIGE